MNSQVPVIYEEKAIQSITVPILLLFKIVKMLAGAWKILFVPELE